MSGQRTPEQVRAANLWADIESAAASAALAGAEISQEWKQKVFDAMSPGGIGPDALITGHIREITEYIQGERP